MDDAAQLKKLAMQSLLPGLTYAAERALETLNEARLVVGFPPLTLALKERNTAPSATPPSGWLAQFEQANSEIDGRPKRGRPPVRKQSASHQLSLPAARPEPALDVRALEELRNEKPVRTLRPKIPMSPAQRKLVGEQSRQRWAIVRESGIRWKGTGSPSSADVERAKKVLAKRAIKSAGA